MSEPSRALIEGLSRLQASLCSIYEQIVHPNIRIAIQLTWGSISVLNQTSIVCGGHGYHGARTVVTEGFAAKLDMA
jgi:hypothetical protein